MSDGIDRIPPIRPAGYGVKAVSAIDPHKHQDSHIQDKVELHPDQRGYQEPEEKVDISLSVATIRIIAQGNLDPEIEAALVAFAPLGDLSRADYYCDILDGRGVEFISWPPGVSLAQALENAAS